MKNLPGVILDLAGTIYRLKDPDGSFANSDFYYDLRQRMYHYLPQSLDLSPVEAMQEYNRIKENFDGSESLRVEQEHSIDRYEWFGNTWNLDPSKYIEPPQNDLIDGLSPLAERSVVLTAAPVACGVSRTFLFRPT